MKIVDVSAGWLADLMSVGTEFCKGLTAGSLGALCSIVVVISACQTDTRSEIDSVPAELLKDTLYVLGAKTFERMNCAACHSLRGTGGVVGPALDELADRMDGTMIREAILEPDRIVKQGFAAGLMPKNFGALMNEKEIDALIYFVTYRP